MFPNGGVQKAHYRNEIFVLQKGYPKDLAEKEMGKVKFSGYT